MEEEEIWRKRREKGWIPTTWKGPPRRPGHRPVGGTDSGIPGTHSLRVVNLARIFLSGARMLGRAMRKMQPALKLEYKSNTGAMAPLHF